MKTLTSTIIALCFVLITSAQETVNLSLSDFKILNNTSWKGTLTYLDYSSGKSETIETTLQIKIENNKIKSSIQYTYEPNKNYNSSVKLRKKGIYYGNEKVIKNTIKNGTRIIITTYNGKDNGKKATFYNIHKFNKNDYSITKEVQLKNDTKRFTRNTYTFKKF